MVKITPNNTMLFVVWIWNWLLSLGLSFLWFVLQVQAHWLRYTEKMDRMVEEAFRLNVKWSLQELSRAINGDGKSAPNPLLRVKVVLEGDKVGCDNWKWLFWPLSSGFWLILIAFTLICVINRLNFHQHWRNLPAWWTKLHYNWQPACQSSSVCQISSPRKGQLKR